MRVSELKDDDTILVTHVSGNMDQDGAEVDVFRMTGLQLKQLVDSKFSMLEGSPSDDEEVRLEHDQDCDEWLEKMEKQKMQCEYACVINSYYGSYSKHQVRHLQKV